MFRNLEETTLGRPVLREGFSPHVGQIPIDGIRHPSVTPR